MLKRSTFQRSMSNSKMVGKWVMRTSLESAIAVPAPVHLVPGGDFQTRVVWLPERNGWFWCRSSASVIRRPRQQRPRGATCFPFLYPTPHPPILSPLTTSQNPQTMTPRKGTLRQLSPFLARPIALTSTSLPGIHDRRKRNEEPPEATTAWSRLPNAQAT